MPTQDESVCCRELAQILDTLAEPDCGQPECITLHPGFNAVCLDRWSLKTAYLTYRQHYGNIERPLHE